MQSKQGRNNLPGEKNIFDQNGAAGKVELGFKNRPIPGNYSPLSLRSSSSPFVYFKCFFLTFLKQDAKLRIVNFEEPLLNLMPSMKMTDVLPCRSQ